MSISGSRRSPYAASNTPIPDRAGGQGSGSSTNGNAAFTAAANNSSGVAKVRSLSAPCNCAVTLTPKVSGKFQVSAFLAATGTTTQVVTFTLSDGTNTWTILGVVDANNNVSACFGATDFPTVGTPVYPLGTPVTWTILATAIGALTTTALKCNVEAVELAA